MVFLRPIVLRDAETSNKLSVDRYDLIRSFQQDQQPRPNLLVPVNEAPVLPPLPRLEDSVVPISAPQTSPGTARPIRRRPRRRRRPRILSPARRHRRHPRREAEPMGARHPLPYAYAKAHTLLLEDDGARLVLWAPENVALPALSEVLRLYEVDGFERESAETLAQPHRRRLRRRRIERRGRGRRGRERGRPVAHDAGAAGDRGPARGQQRRADHPHAQRPAHPGGEGRRQRHPHRALRALELGALSRRRHAARGGAAQPRPARGADLAPEDHGRARHRREAPAAGRPHLAAHRRPRRRRARLDAAHRRTASARCCVCSTRPNRSSALEGLRHERRRAAPVRRT